MCIRIMSLLTGLVLAALAASAQKPDWQEHLDWSIRNSDAGGSVDCPDKYLATYPECHISGGRSCMMKKAIQSAKDNDCANALRVSVITQCHNVTARRPDRKSWTDGGLRIPKNQVTLRAGKGYFCRPVLHDGLILEIKVDSSFASRSSFLLIFFSFLRYRQATRSRRRKRNAGPSRS